MSNDLESDSELISLRNELLISLTKKKKIQNDSVESSDRSNQSTTVTEENFNNQVKVEEEEEEEEYEEENEEDDLEKLRLEALNASKRIKSHINHNKKNIPGRFRYDKDSDEEEEEDDLEYKYFNNTNNYDEEDELKTNDDYTNKSNFMFYRNNNINNNKYDLVNEMQQSKHDLNNKKAEFNNYHYNYQTYRVECSKLMPNDAYEPDSANDIDQESLPEGFDLRNFLREKAFKKLELEQQHSLTLNYTPTKIDSSSVKNIEDLDYSQPITKPIEIKKELLFGNKYYKTNNYHYSRNNKMGGYLYNAKEINRNMNYNNSTSYKDSLNLDKNNNTDLIESNVGKYRKRKNSINEEEKIENSDNEESDEDLKNNFKKLKSVVVAKAVVVPNSKSEKSKERSRYSNSSSSSSSTSFSYHKRKKYSTK